MRLRPFHLALALDGDGWHPQARRGDGDPSSPVWWSQVGREIDDGPFAFATIADGHRSAARSSARLEALLTACRLAAQTETVGIVPQVNTSITEPFLVSSQLATLDHVSGGRAGWEVEVAADGDAGYVGARPAAATTQRFAEAAEHVEVVQRLWDSWEDDAEIRDAATQRFIDRERIHPIEFAGRHLSILGPSITPRPPQGQPLTTTVARDDASDRFAAAHCDVAFLAAPSVASVADRLAAVRGLTTATGRVALAPLCLAEIAVLIDDTAAQARRRREQLDALGDGPEWSGLVCAGTPADLAALLDELARLGCDGVRLHPAETAHDLPRLTRELAAPTPDPSAPPAAATLRERLRFARTPSRYAALR